MSRDGETWPFSMFLMVRSESPARIPHRESGAWTPFAAAAGNRKTLKLIGKQERSLPQLQRRHPVLDEGRNATGCSGARSNRNRLVRDATSVIASIDCAR